LTEVSKEEPDRTETSDSNANIRLSVVVVSWNTRDLLRDCLGSVYATIEGIEFEVIVVDNKSIDGTPEMIRKKFPQVRLIQNDENLGYAAANNQGMFAGEGEYILCLNPDTVVYPGVINRVVAFLESNPDYAVAGCRLKSLDGTYQTAVAKLFSPMDKFTIYGFCHYLYKAGIIKTHPYDRVKYSDDYLRLDGTVDYMIGAFSMIRRQLLETVGGLDPEFFFCVDDLDWGLRINKAGLKIKHLMDCEILHLANQSGKQVDRFSTEFTGSAHFWAKHYGLLGQFMFDYFKFSMMLRDCTTRALHALRLAKLQHVAFAVYMLLFLPLEMMILFPLEIRHRRLIKTFPGC
jgi:GT2 family glycosyltransferase